MSVQSFSFVSTGEVVAWYALVHFVILKPEAM